MLFLMRQEGNLYIVLLDLSFDQFSRGWRLQAPYERSNSLRMQAVMSQNCARVFLAELRSFDAKSYCG